MYLSLKHILEKQQVVIYKETEHKMRNKSILLSSLFILSACGGGSGSPEVNMPNKPDIPFIPQEDTVASSNAKITNMVSNSEYQVALFVSNKLGTDAESVGLGNVTDRGATTRGAFIPSHSGELDYDKAAELVEMAGWLNQSDTSAEDIIAEFNKDRNKIKAALKLLDDMYCFVGGDAAETARRILEIRGRNGFDDSLANLQDKSEIMTLDNANFKAIFTSGVLNTLKFNVDKNGKIVSLIVPDAEEIMETHPGSTVPDTEIVRQGNTNRFIYTDPDSNKWPMDYISYAKDLKLKYADFGVLQTDLQELGYGIRYVPFAGGYENKKIDTDSMIDLAQANDLTFTGIAQGDVTYNDGNKDIPLAGGLKDENATLVFNKDGVQTLTANFDNWHNVQAIKSADGTNQFKIIGGTGGDDARFHMSSSSAGLKDEVTQEVANNPEANEVMVFNPGYYGDKNTPTEATALMQYQYSPKGNTSEGQIGAINVQLGFGGTIK